MTQAAKPRREGLIARFLRLLGFRLVFPIGTMPIPYHPLVFPLALLAILGWFGWSIWASLETTQPGHVWWQPLPFFALLGVLMSVPIVAWAAMVFRAPLLQGLLGAAVPALVTAEVVGGNLPTSWLAFPVAYVANFAFMLWNGPRWLARVQAENDAFEPVSPGQATLALDWRVHQPERDVEHIDAPRVWARKLKGRDGTLAHWITLEDADRIEAAAGGRLPREWRLSRREKGALLKQPCAHPPEDSIAVWDRPARAPLRCVTGLKEYGLRLPDCTLRLRRGEARLVGKLPLFVAFHWTAIFGGKSEWHIGFPRVKSVRVEPEALVHNSCLRTLIRPRPEDGGIYDTTHVEEIIRHFEKLADERLREAAVMRERQDEFWDELPTFAQVPLHLKPHYEALVAEKGAVDEGRLGEVLDWLERCRDTPSQAGFYKACMLLDTFPDSALLPEGARIAKIFNSRRIALQWDIAEVPDTDKLPANTPVCAMNTAGFGVFRGLPLIYQRLGTLLPELAGVNEGLAREYANPEPGLRLKGVVRSL